jgi:hypothetical protein
MALVERVDDDLRAAMKARDELRTSVLRMLKAALKNREIEKMAALTDDDAVAVASSLIKQRRDSVEQFTKAGRKDLADREAAEIAVLEGYLPEQLSEAELVETIKAAIAEASATSPNDMGKVMKVLMPKVKGRADGKLVNQKVKELLGG